LQVAIELQLSNLSVEAITYRTKEYERKGIYVLWLPHWTPALDAKQYSPPLWEKWIHAAYFGRAYYWVSGLSVVTYRFNPHYRHIPQTSWYSPSGKKLTVGGHVFRSKHQRTPVRGKTLHLVRDFIPRHRRWWKGGKLEVPYAKLFMPTLDKTHIFSVSDN
jgi:competence protein CoiA